MLVDTDSPMPWPHPLKPIVRHFTIAQVCSRLARVHGPVKPPRAMPVLDELVATIMSQNTSDLNSSASFESLKRGFSSWDAVRRARTATVIRAIERGGLARQKGPRIKAVLSEIQKRRGRLSLQFLRRMSDGDALEFLRSFDGVGPKTAACVLLFACRKPVLPVDTHVHSVSRRLGLIGPKVSAEAAHDELASMVEPKRVLDFHILLVRHGRTVCTARNPTCRACVLAGACPSAEI